MLLFSSSFTPLLKGVLLTLFMIAMFLPHGRSQIGHRFRKNIG